MDKDIQLIDLIKELDLTNDRLLLTDTLIASAELKMKEDLYNAALHKVDQLTTGYDAYHRRVLAHRMVEKKYNDYFKLYVFSYLIEIMNELNIDLTLEDFVRPSTIPFYSDDVDEVKHELKIGVIE